ncbi:hypothetical protein BMG00_11200 [Thioclava marina]|uniref:Uncharacterized protein n=1 Tax=Thioclava marina TaxID=1915077 RepID=A0ABX3MJD1_9RHOB|nr:hypothetical protein [Thioclava marina]OOY11661.1 hypothetical protein BMG00_11200 [Thioclava marina]
MTYDRTAIMKAAWVIVRRFLGRTRETLAQILSRALKLAWWDAKQEAQVAKAVATKRAEADTLAQRSSADLKVAIVALENTDTLGGAGRDRLSDLQAALRHAEAREAADYAAKRKLIASAKGRFASITFTKKDGTHRVMRVQPATLRQHVKGADASDAGRRAAETRAQRHPNLLPVWDAERKAPRSVNLATVSQIKVNGVTHEFCAR